MFAVTRYGRKIGYSIQLQETQGIGYGLARTIIGCSQTLLLGAVLLRGAGMVFYGGMTGEQLTTFIFYTNFVAMASFDVGDQVRACLPRDCIGLTAVLCCCKERSWHDAFNLSSLSLDLSVRDARVLSRDMSRVAGRPLAACPCSSIGPQRACLSSTLRFPGWRTCTAGFFIGMTKHAHPSVKCGLSRFDDVHACDCSPACCARVAIFRIPRILRTPRTLINSAFAASLTLEFSPCSSALVSPRCSFSAGMDLPFRSHNPLDHGNGGAAVVEGNS